MKGDIHSPPRETFNLNDVSGGSQEDATDAAVVPDAGPATPSRRQRRIARQAKAGSRRGKAAEDISRFFVADDAGKRMCKFCL